LETEIRFTGLRDGEKLTEELAYASEEIHPTSSPKIGRIHGTPQGWIDLNRQLRQLRQFMSTKSDTAIRAKLRDIVPEYSPQTGNVAGRDSANPVPQAANPGILHATMALP
jgi:FlaA1/EpsC-like NDP-sugar epimerase